MKMRFWGVRGSYPVPGPETNRYGGNTACVQVVPSSGDIVIVDAGTGIRKLGQELAAGPCRNGCTIHLLISHTHWDHVQGLPFFAPLHLGGTHIKIYSRRHGDVHLRNVFEKTAEAPYFPIPFSEFRASVEFVELAESTDFHLGTVSVRTTPLNHPFEAMACRIEEDGCSMVYASDTAPFDRILLGREFVSQPPDPGTLTEPEKARLAELHRGLVDLCRGADLVVYDTHFTEQEYQARPHWGHSTPSQALSVALEAGAARLCLFHHAPEHTDEQMDEILESARRDAAGRIEVIAAQEGMTIDLSERKSGADPAAKQGGVP